MAAKSIAGVSRAVAAPRHAAPASAAAMLVRAISELESAKTIGVRILEGESGRTDTASLIRVIGARLDLGTGGAEAAILRCSVPELRRRIAAAVKADFAAGRTTEVDGWVLAETEARLCLMAALGPDDGRNRARTFDHEPDLSASTASAVSSCSI